MSRLAQCEAPTDEDFSLIYDLSWVGVLLAAYVLELAAKAIGTAPLVGHLVAGLLLGPPLANAVAYTEGMRLLGKLGVMLLVIESGLSIDLRSLRRVGLRAFAAAAVGVVGPVALAMLSYVFIFDSSPRAALAAGAAIAPTSLGFSAQLLADAGQLSSPMGTLIAAAAVIDDVLSLTLLSEIHALERESPTAWQLAAPVVASLGAILVGGLLALLLPPLLMALDVRLAQAKQGWGDRAAILLLFVAAGLCSSLCSLARTSDLLGAFVGALVFSSSTSVRQAFQRHVSPFVRWGSMLFFAATIGFSAPHFSALLSGPALLRGLCLFAAAVLGKALLGVFASPLTGLSCSLFAAAMNGRGEFSFLIAQEAADDGVLLEDEAAGAVIGILASTVLAPLVFKGLLVQLERAFTNVGESGGEGEGGRGARSGAGRPHLLLTGWNPPARRGASKRALPQLADREGAAGSAVEARSATGSWRAADATDLAALDVLPAALPVDFGEQGDLLAGQEALVLAGLDAGGGEGGDDAAAAGHQAAATVELATVDGDGAAGHTASNGGGPKQAV